MNILRNSIALLASTSMMVFAGEKVDQSLPIDGVTSVEIENLRGEINVVGNSSKAISVVGELDEEATGFIFEQQGSVVLIKVEMPRHLENGWTKQATELDIALPQHINVSFSGVSTDVSIKNFEADVSASSVSGNVSIDQITKRVEVNAVSGDISANNIGTVAHLSNVSGNIKTSGAQDSLYVKSVSGDINASAKAKVVEAKNVSGEMELSLAQVEDLMISTVSGDADVDLSLMDNAKVRLSSVSGDFRLNFLNDVQAIFRLRSNAGGDLVNKLTSTKAKEDKYGPSSSLSFETGNGSSRVSGSTVSGNIILVRK